METHQDHIPVLLQEFLEFFQEKTIEFFVDGTTGAGGHSRALLEAHPEIQRLIAIDIDPSALVLAEKTLAPWKEKVEFVEGNFSEISSLLRQKKIPCVQGFFIDLGVSSMQLSLGERGFSFQKKGPLDMRMGPSVALTAERLVNDGSQKELERIFRDFGEESKWRQAAKAIVEYRRKKPIKTTEDLSEALAGCLRRKGHRHPLTLVFQGLRIAVNEELISLEKGLTEGMKALCPQGRMGVISFHSLEDRIVKWTFKEAHLKKEITLLTKKPKGASQEERRKNPRSRSAKMRFVEKRSHE